MDKVMNWLCRGAVFALCASSTLSALTLGARECGKVEGWAHALYWKPTYGRVVWATELDFSGPPRLVRALYSGNLRSRAISPRYSWGVEAGATYLAGQHPFFAEGSGLYLHEQNSSRITGNLTPTLPFVNGTFLVSPNFFVAGSGRGDLSLYYGKADLKGGFVLPLSCCLSLRPFSGVRYVYLQEELVIHIAGTYLLTTGPVSVAIDQIRRLLFSGTGPTIGLSGRLSIFGGLGVDASCALMTLVGTQKNTSRALFSAPIVTDEVEPGHQRFTTDRCVAIIPGIDAHLTLSCTRCWRRMTARVELGYTLTHYRAAFNQMMGSATNFPSLIGQPNKRDVGFAGPHIGGSIAF